MINSSIYNRTVNSCNSILQNGGFRFHCYPKLQTHPQLRQTSKNFPTQNRKNPPANFSNPQITNHKPQMGFEPRKPTHNNPQIANTIQNSHRLCLGIVQEFQNMAVELVAFLIQEPRLVVLLLQHHIVKRLRLRLRVHRWGWRRRRTVNPKKGLCGDCWRRRWWWSRG
jgi:hypothetical protein